MKSSNLVRLDFDALMRDAMEGHCFTSQTKLAQAAGIHRQTIQKIKKGEAVRETVARELEFAINEARKNLEAKKNKPLPKVDWRNWLVTEPSATAVPEKRNARGRWHVKAEDIPVKKHFKYAYGPRQLEMDVIVEQTGRELTATGVDGDGDMVKSWAAEFCGDDWAYISGKHAIGNDRVHLEGVFFLKYLNRGDRMLGYYLQTETDHQCDIVLGHLELTLVEVHGRPVRST